MLAVGYRESLLGAECLRSREVAAGIEPGRVAFASYWALFNFRALETLICGTEPVNRVQFSTAAMSLLRVVTVDLGALMSARLASGLML